MQIDFKIIPATINDLDEIAASEVNIFKENAWYKASIEAELYWPHSDLFIVRDSSSALMGYSITWCLVDKKTGEKDCEVLTLAVNEEYRQQGVASALLNNVIELYGNNCIWHLEVATDNLAAINLYKKFGFKEEGRIKDYYGMNQDAFRMTKR